MQGKAKIVTHGGVVRYQVTFDGGRVIEGEEWEAVDRALAETGCTAEWVGDAIQRPHTGPGSRLLP